MRHDTGLTRIVGPEMQDEGNILRETSQIVIEEVNEDGNEEVIEKSNDEVLHGEAWEREN